jgi:hypothetical protein
MSAAFLGKWRILEMDQWGEDRGKGQAIGRSNRLSPGRRIGVQGEKGKVNYETAEDF